MSVSRETRNEKDESMNDTVTVEIPADVKDNSRAAVRVQWRNTRPVELAEIEGDRQYAYLHGYAVHEWDDVDREGRRVTLVRLIDKIGMTVELYEVSYFTRIACTDCEHSYAESYIRVTDADGVTHHAAPFCGTHGDMVKKIAQRQPGYSYAESEPLHIGQHD